jgi:hypothetical protein
MDYMSVIYGFYHRARAFIRPNTSSARRSGVRHRLERWLILAKCVRWAAREYFPEGKGYTEAVAYFLVNLGRCWTFGGTAQALSWIKKVRELFLFVLAHPDEPGRTNQAKRRLRRVFGRRVVVDRLHESEPEFLQFLLTVLTLMRGVRVPPVLDTLSITDPPKVILDMAP